MKTNLEVMQLARDIFAEKGGGKHYLMNHHGKVCAIGALNMALNDGDWGHGDWGHTYSAQADELTRCLNFTVIGRAQSIVDFNNSDYITKEDVLACFDTAILKLKEVS